MAQYTILLVDYEPRSVEQLRAVLEQAGYRVDVAKDGVAGAERFHSLKPDLALLEAMLPKKHGFELCQELKRTPHGRMTPIVIITGVYKGRKYRAQAMHQYGCDAFLEKPITAEQLLETLGRFLDRTAMTRTTASSPPPTGTPAVPRGTVEEEITGRLDAILSDDGHVGPASGARGSSVPVGGSKGPRASISGGVLSFEKPIPRPAATTRPMFVRGGAQPALFSRADLEEEDDVRGVALPDDELGLSDPSVGLSLVEDDPGETAGRSYPWIALAAVVAFGVTLLILLV